MKLSKYIDHTLLKADASLEAIRKLCDEAKEYDFMSVCVNPFFVPFASEYLEGTGVKVCTVIGFPNGYNTTAITALTSVFAAALLALASLATASTNSVLFIF